MHSNFIPQHILHIVFSANIIQLCKSVHYRRIKVYTFSIQKYTLLTCKSVHFYSH